MFLCTQKRNSVGSDKTMNMFLFREKIAHFVYRHDVAKVGDIYNWDPWGNSISLVGSN